MAHFAVENLTFAYPCVGQGASRPALSDVSLEIERGSYVVLCGKSGCGKTTLLRHLKSVLTPHGRRSGRVLFGGVSLDDVSQAEQAAKIGFVMQDPEAQVVTDRVWHELAFGLESLGADQRVMRLRVAEMASYFGIQEWFHKDVQDLSGGQKQLLSLASVMAMQPEVLVLDEPTSQLDPIAAADFLNTVRKINLELGTTVVITEHRLEDVLPHADKVVVMEGGRVLAQGAPREVGRALCIAGDDMVLALPAPMRVFYGVAASEVPHDCPLTVREGRAWLTRRCDENPPARTALPEYEIFEGSERNPVPNPAPNSARNSAIQLDGVWFRYGRDLPDVLRGVSLSVPRGQLFAVVGGNGTGKSTMLKAIAGVARPHRGTVRIEGRRLKDWKSGELFRGCLAMLPQDPQNLFVKKTVREDLDEMLDGLGLSQPERAARVEAAAERAEVSHVLNAHPYDLSGGEQQRAALAKVMLTNPRILLLDEPTKGIDAFFKRKLAEILRGLVAEGVTIVMVSHDIEFCACCADAVALFFDGSVVTSNTPRRFFASNGFYTTAANRMSRHVFQNAVTVEDVVELCAAR